MNQKNIYNMVMFRNQMECRTRHDKFENIALNTGNMVFAEALRKNMHVDVMPYAEYLSTEWKQNIVDAVLTTDLIWITQNANFDYLIKQMETIDKPFIPMSIGVQNRLNDIDYSLNESVLKVLNMMQERAVLGVRGEITADILNKNGIKNIQVIGCPSMYYWAHPNFKIEKKEQVPKEVMYNFRTFYGRLSKDEAHFMSYCAGKEYEFVEQNEYDLLPQMCPSQEYYDYVSKKMEGKIHTFFEINEWKKFAKDFDFSIGSRFHGNVVALWNNVPALFIMIDSRMREMLEYFKLPYIQMKDFDETKGIEFYYDLADYTEFNKKYEANYNNYLDFLKKNHMIF